MRKSVTAVLILAIVIPTLSFAEQSHLSGAVATSNSVRKELLKLESKAHVVVRLRNNETVEGDLGTLGTTSFFVTDSAKHVSTQIAYTNVKGINAMSNGQRMVVTVVVIAAVALVLVILRGTCGTFVEC